MKKQYMDFVPSKAVKTVRPVRQTKPSAPEVKIEKTHQMVGVRHQVVKARPQNTGKMSFSTEKAFELGVVEELNPKFVKTDVPKRPLSTTPHFKSQSIGVVAAKAQKVGNKSAVSFVEKPVEKVAKKPVESTKKPADNIYRPPKAQFINQNKVQKRPLSKNVYTKKVETPKEEPKGPVTIISKPEKQAHVGLIVTIILTIILGAAAGTIAFLLLPK